MQTSSEEVKSLSPIKRALWALQEMEVKLKRYESAMREPIAVIGLACRFPYAQTPDAFWQLLREGVDAVREVPRERFDVDAYYDSDPDRPNKMYTRFGAFIKGVDQFDPQFFGISPREALELDPQQRLLLEVSWEALERAGVAVERLANSRTGVFIGIGENGYAFQMNSGDLMGRTAYEGTGNGLSFAAGRLSYVLGLQGPSMAIDTTCSSSLVAAHLAMMSLRARESDLALVGGVQLLLSPELSLSFSRLRALAPDGRCKSFDAAADGYGRGEGCGVVVLKRLSDALADGDRILALLRGSAVNHDGPASGLTVPNALAQEALIRAALKNGQVEPSEVGYVEAHGTGTVLGDPIEVQALTAVFGQREHPLLIGTVKTNIGHLEWASGIAGLIKVVLSLQHEEIPPNLHFHTPNPYISWDASKIMVPTECIPCSDTSGGRLAGISSFGMSGTNAHLIVEKAPASPQSILGLRQGGGNENQNPARPWHLLCLSAKTKEVLKEIVAQYEAYLSTHPEAAWADVCFTANCGRSHFKHRTVIIAQTAADARPKLAVWEAKELDVSRQPKIAFLFTGQGSQYVDMGRQLYETQPTFRFWLERCRDILLASGALKEDLLSVLYPPAQASSPLQQTALRNPLCLRWNMPWRSFGNRGASNRHTSAGIASGNMSPLVSRGCSA